MSKLRINRFYYRNGRIHTEIRYWGRELHGYFRTWHFNSQLAEEYYYRHGLMHGANRQWDEKGCLLGTFTMKHGTGTQRYWHENGQLSMEMDTVGGEFHGRLRMWLMDGTLIEENFFIGTI
jgi:antitoxin component YwqK of YwqJK toxin-antitoxin module